jgi:hypothetical protein
LALPNARKRRNPSLGLWLKNPSVWPVITKLHREISLKHRAARLDGAAFLQLGCPGRAPDIAHLRNIVMLRSQAVEPRRNEWVEVWLLAKREGWRARKIGKEWCQFCGELCASKLADDQIRYRH